MDGGGPIKKQNNIMAYFSSFKTTDITFTVEDLNRMNSPAAIAELLQEKIKAETKSDKEIQKENKEPEVEATVEESKEKFIDPKSPNIKKGQPTPKKGKFPIKWVVGRKYKLRFKGKAGLRGYEKTYVLKKFIYTIGENTVNVVIMKQIAGPKSAIFTLTKVNCIHYHIKYEPDLQVMSMSLNWIPVNE